MRRSSCSLRGAVSISAALVGLVFATTLLDTAPTPASAAGSSCQWRVVSAPAGSLGYANRLEAVVSLAANDAWAVGWLGAQAAVEHWDGSAWAIVPIPAVAGASQSRLLGIDAASPSDIWAVGYAITSTYHTLTMHWNDAAWTIVACPDQRFPARP